MSQCQRVFIAQSLDGYIADRDGKIDWLQSIPNPDQLDLGYADFMANTEAIVMGRATFETVLGFGGAWPYAQPVFVLSRTLTQLPAELRGQVYLLHGSAPDILAAVHQRGYQQLYLDGGEVIQQFLQADLVDELIITTLPILLGGGRPLFGTLTQPLRWQHLTTTVLLHQMVQTHYRRAGRQP